MVFNSLVFLVFFAIVYVAYRLLPHRGQNVLILVSSYIFYGWWDWRFCGLIALTSLCSWGSGLAIGHFRRRGASRAAWWSCAANVGLNLGILGVFKYYDFFASSAAAAAAALGWTADVPLLRVILPVGISFYTFQALSYTLDVHRGQMRPTRNAVDFCAFVAFFPQLVAGPIERASNLLPQIENPRTVTPEGTREGIWLVAWGLFKKCVIADNLAVLVDGVFNGGGTATAGGAACLLAVYAFAFQIYCDFSGYSDIARGLAKMMGVDLMLNFNNPYFALNPKDFWARWHISLSTWLRDYLYIPLGGNRRGAARKYANLFLTMLLGGLWHGAAWTFVAWGAFHGALLVAYHAWTSWMGFGKGRVDSGRCVWLRRIAMFNLACVGWLFFRAETIAQAWSMLGAIFGRWAWDAQAANILCATILFAAPLWAVQALQVASGRLDAPRRLSPVPRIALWIVMAVGFLLFGNTGGGAFIYFQF